MGTMNIWRKRSAFTLIELLVVIAIIGVLVGLLLPAVQQAREAARRSACGNKMKQNALAMHTYADANRSLPSGSSRRSEGSTAQNTVWKSFTVELMPFIEMSTVYDQLDLTKSQLDGTRWSTKFELVDSSHQLLSGESNLYCTDFALLIRTHLLGER